MSKTKDNDETLYDKIIRQLKNNPIIVAIMVIGVIIIAISQFLNTSKSLLPTKLQVTEVHITFQRFDNAGQYDGSPLLRSPTLKDNTNLSSVATDIVGAIATQIRSAQSPNFKANLEINGNILKSDQPIHADLITGVDTTSIASAVTSANQTVQRIDIDDLVAGDNISQRFADKAIFRPDCNCIHLEFNAPVDGYEDGSLDIFQLQNGYSFNAGQLVNKKSVLLNPSLIKILIAFPQGQGAEEKDLNATGLTLDGEIRQQIQKNKFIVISPYKSQDEYQAQIEKAVAALKIGPGKTDYLTQNGIDYIVTIAFVLK